MRFATPTMATPLLLAPQSEMNVLYLGARHWRVAPEDQNNFERFVRALTVITSLKGLAWDFRLCRRSLKLTAVGSSFSAAWVMDLLHNDSIISLRTLPPMNRILIVEDNPTSPFWKLGCRHTVPTTVVKTGREAVYGSGAEFDLLLWTWDCLTLMD